MHTQILQTLCAIPTAPFAEHYVSRYVERFVAQRPALRLRRDRFGNLLIELPGRTRGPRWVFAAHMDHPGFVAGKMTDDRTLLADFRGWVRIDYVRGAKVRFFFDDAGGATRQVTGSVIAAEPTEHDRLTVPGSVTLRVGAPVPPGAPGMFDAGEGTLGKKRFSGRVCDDLAGAAAALTMLDELIVDPPRTTVAVLLTRAEEEGFIGAIAAARNPQLLRKSDRIVAIETSALQPCAPQGQGAIIRVGDKASIFNSSLSYFLTQQAENLAESDKSFRFQRALMPGGTCEATVYDVYGYIAGSICVALGNYHNMNLRTGRIGPEYIDLSDWRNMTRLFVHLARGGHAFRPGHRPLRQRIEKRYNRLKQFL